MASQLPSPASSAVMAPQSVEQIVRRAQEFQYSPQVSLRSWLRTAASLIKEARIYEREGRDEQVYLLLFRHAQLVLAHLVNHPEAKEEKNHRALRLAEKEVQANLAKLEALKPRINKRYERYMRLMREREARRPVSSDRRDDVPPFQRRLAPDPALAGVAEPLEPGENRELAVRLAQREFSRRATARKATRQAGTSQQEGDWEEASKDSEGPSDDLCRRIQQVRLNIDQTPLDDRRPSIQSPPSRRSGTERSSTQSVGSAYRYPTVPRHRPLDVGSPAAIRPQEQRSDLSKPPDLPPKERIPPAPPVWEEPPPRPAKVLPGPLVPEKKKLAEGAGVSNSDLNPSTYTFKPSAYLENGTPLRTIFLPPNLRTEFLKVAAPNTRRNLETCGILCGTLISNAFFISKLLIPEQESTSDTCETVNESAIFDYCDSEDLMVLGWIHTHPTQTCFMSSRDLHTHCGYQMMLPESIAIVCAPSKQPDWGVFRLTDPPGLKTVSNCTQTGLFHPHAEQNIYTDALRPGHVFEATGLEFETVDLRPSK
ncbi:hypothetical protein VTN02DRAFT_1643 [Thermoascus thermophilus]